MPERESDLQFNDIVPLAFRIVLFLELGIFLWYALIRICHGVFRINVLAILNLSFSTRKYSHSNAGDFTTGEYATVASADLEENVILTKGVYRTLRLTFALNFAGLATYWASLVFSHEKSFFRQTASIYFPALLFFITLHRAMGKGASMGQTRMFTTLKRVLVGQINSTTMRTNDILLSDSLTSYAKVLNDVFMLAWTILMPADKGYNVYLETFVLAYPALIRIKQCWYEHSHTRDRNHFYNMLKYSCQVGPLVINMLIKLSMSHLTSEKGISPRLLELNFWWYIFSAVSSTYSFIWDIRMDWEFGLFEPVFRPKTRRFEPIRNRSQLVFNNFLMYYVAIIVDFFVRFIWVFKMFVMKEAEMDLGLRHRVGNFLFGYDFLSFGYVLLETLEILRRWIWCFLKLECEFIKFQEKNDLAHAVPLAALDK